MQSRGSRHREQVRGKNLSMPCRPVGLPFPYMSTLFTERVVAIAGRPNVGKSAIFNRIVRRRLSIVHEEVGVTRDRVSAEAEYQERKFEVIDTGGLGFIDG